MKDHLSGALLPLDLAGGATWRSATVDDDDPIQVRIAQQGGLSASWIQAYTEGNPPSAQDQVLVLQTNTDILIVGRIINGGE